MKFIDKTLPNNKRGVIKYFRNRKIEIIEDIRRNISTSEYKNQSSEFNKEISKTWENLLHNIRQVSEREKWSKKELLISILITTYAYYIVLIEGRNDIWPYEYMSFSRRIGELWEPFCRLCFEYSLKDITFFTPPLFSEVKTRLTNEIVMYINKLSISPKQKQDLIKYYDKVWALVTSGEIKMELDLHFEQNDYKYNIDFKSGFSSNEKGNTNRLLLVSTIYKNLEGNHICLLLVRAKEDQNNNYFQTLKNSGVWKAYCGDSTYNKINDFTGFNLREWINKNIDWKNDFDEITIKHFKKNDLLKYLIW